MLLLANDVTATNLTKTQLLKLSRAVEQSLSAIVIMDSEFRVEFVNPAFTRTSGFSAEEVIGKNAFSFHADLHENDFLTNIQATLSAGNPWQGEMRNRKKDGTVFWEYATISPIKNESGQLSGYVAIKEDISQRKEAEQQLVKMQKEAQAANRAKSLFLANMSHDIRTPMNGIIGMVRLALETELTRKQEQYLRHIQTSADGLLGLLNDILDFSRIEAGQLTLEQHDFKLPAMLDNILSMMTFAAQEKGIELILQNNDPDLPVHVRGDELRLRQILINLVGNSIKFVEQGHVIVGVESPDRQEKGITLHFMVEDTGIGIPEHLQEKIFSSFNQADSSITRKFGGTGLGLAISKQLVKMMGGRIWLESEVDKGTTFHFTVTLDRGRSPKVRAAETEQALQMSQMKILLVDDNVLNRKIARHILDKDRHRVVMADNGMEALEHLLTDEFDLILMDIQMPIMDGLTACMIIRTGENGEDLKQFDLPPELAEKLCRCLRGRYTPIVAMTANAMDDDRRKCMAAGMDDYLTKPFVPEQMRVIVSQARKTR